MKSKLYILKNIENTYSSYMKVLCIFNFGHSIFESVTYKLIPFEDAKEEYYHIANASNNFWKLIDV